MLTASMTISLEGVRLYGHHGVFPQEKKVGAEFEVWVDLTLPCPDGCDTDCLADTVSSADLYELVREEFARPSDLLEHLVKCLVETVSQRWPGFSLLSVKVRKVAPPIPSFQGSASVSLSLSNV